MGTRLIWLAALLAGAAVLVLLLIGPGERRRAPNVPEPQIRAVPDALMQEPRAAQETPAVSLAPADPLLEAADAEPEPELPTSEESQHESEETAPLASANWRPPQPGGRTQRTYKRGLKEMLRQFDQPPDPLTLRAQRELWDRHMGGLYYPENHPRAGQLRDGVTPQQLADARKAYIDAVMPADYLNRHVLMFRDRRLNFRRVNERSRSWDRFNTESSREFGDWINAEPDDPKAPVSTMSLPADPSDPDATTAREELHAIIDELASETSTQ